jgi:ribosome-associated heat shock protein Hsp15
LNAERQRIDVWLHRARFAKTRGAAARLVTEGGVRLVRGGASRQLDRASAEVEAGDALVLPLRGQLRTVRIAKLGGRRGPPAEARQLYAEIQDADEAAGV